MVELYSMGGGGGGGGEGKNCISKKNKKNPT